MGYSKQRGIGYMNKTLAERISVLGLPWFFKFLFIKYYGIWLYNNFTWFLFSVDDMNEVHKLFWQPSYIYYMCVTYDTAIYCVYITYVIVTYYTYVLITYETAKWYA